METEILKIKGDWQEVVDDCRSTVGKEELGKEPSTMFKKKILIAEHSPIRDIEVKFRWKNIPYWCAMHWKTHKWESRVNTQRNDRQKEYDRNEAPQNMPVTFTGEANAQHLIDTMRKRLCNKADPLTRKYAEHLKLTLKQIEPELADALVPNCVYRCGCPEPETCGWFQHFFLNMNPKTVVINLQQRNDQYNLRFYRYHKIEEYEKE